MSLASLRKNISSRNSDVKAILAKSKKVKQSTSRSKAGSTLYEKIKNLCDQVERRLSNYIDDFECVTTYERLVSYIDKAISNGFIAIDTETTGLDPITDQIVGVCIYTPNEKPAYIPINHISLVTNIRINNQLTNEQVTTQFKRLVESKVKNIFFNAKFDIRVIRHQLGIDLPCYWDASIAAKVLKFNEEEQNLKYLWKKYCSENKDEAHFTFDKMFQGYCFNIIPIKTAYLYAAKDAIMTWELYKFQEPYLTKEDQRCKDCGFEKLSYVFHNIESPIISVVADIEDNGITLDKEYVEKLSNDYHKRLDEQLDAFYQELEIYQDKIVQWRNTHPQTKIQDPLNIGSPAQLAELFYDVLGLESVSKKQPRGTGEDILLKLNHPLSKLILDYRGTAKLLSTYIDKMPEVVNSKTNKIHCSFNQIGADCITGESIIPTKEGFFTIKELVGDTCKEDGKFYDIDINILNKNKEWEQATKAIAYHNVPTIKIKCSKNICIEGTFNHPVMVSQYNNAAWKKLKPYIKDSFWEGRYFKKLEDIQIGDFLEIPCDWNIEKDLVSTNWKRHEFKTHKSNNGYIPEFINEELAEFLGIYHADGSIDKGAGSFKIIISNGNDHVIERVTYLAKKIFNVDVRITIGSRYEKDKYITIPMTHCKDIENDLSKGALNKKIPKKIKQSSSNIIKAYIKGLCLDSTQWKEETFMIHVKDKEDARFIQNFLISQDVLSCLKQESYTYKGEKRFQYGVKITKQELNKFIRTFSALRNKPLFKSNLVNPHYNKLNGSFRVKVRSIEYSYNDVYDLHVPGTHSFVSNGVISHNTSRFSSSNPNMQNIPSHCKDIRKMFTASEGYVLVGADFSKQEPVVTADLSGDQSFIEMLKAGKDPYAVIASIAFKQPYEECLEFRPDGTTNPEGKRRRGEAKAIFLGKQFGFFGR